MKSLKRNGLHRLGARGQNCIFNPIYHFVVFCERIIPWQIMKFVRQKVLNETLSFLLNPNWRHKVVAAALPFSCGGELFHFTSADIARRHFARTFYAREPSSLPACCVYSLILDFRQYEYRVDGRWPLWSVYMSEIIFFLFRMCAPIRHRHSFFCFAFLLCLLRLCDEVSFLDDIVSDRDEVERKRAEMKINLA